MCSAALRLGDHPSMCNLEPKSSKCTVVVMMPTRVGTVVAMVTVMPMMLRRHNDNDDHADDYDDEGKSQM